MVDNFSNCALCPIKKSERACKTKSGKCPPGCPTENLKELLEEAMKEYHQADIHEFARLASIQETQGYGDKDLGYNRARPIKPVYKKSSSLLKK